MRNQIGTRGQDGRMTAYWADEVIRWHKVSGNELKYAKIGLTDSVQDYEYVCQYNRMIDSMEFTNEWIETCRQPGVYSGVDKRDAYKVKQYDEMEITPDINEELREEREPLYMDRGERQALIQLFRNF